MRQLKITLAAALATIMTAGFTANAENVSLTVTRVAQIDNLDQFDIVPDRADFYATVWINGVRHQTQNFSFDDGNPGWTFTGNTDSRFVTFRIKLADDDGGLEDRDDFVDINRKNKKKDLEFTLDTKTGHISGDVQGRRGQMITSSGRGDDDKGLISFMVK